MYFLASDYDGTLNQTGIITQQDIEWIENFRSLGHKFGIATGRHLNSILSELDKYGVIVDFTIGNNGSAILDEARQVFYMADIDKKIVLDVVNFVTTNLQQYFYFFAANNGYHYGQTLFHDDSNLFVSSDSVDLESVMQSERICAMFGQVLPGVDAVAISRIINERYQGIVNACPNGEFVDVVLPENNKAQGISRVIDGLQLDFHDVFAIGDSFNDIEMIQTYHGFVIASGEKTVLPLGNRVVESVSEAIQLILDGRY